MLNTLFQRLLLVASVSTAHAITDQEREVFERLTQELQTAQALVKEAQHAANPHDRERVDYRQLHADLDAISQGLQAIVNAPRREPRALPPISGAYR